jgi:hypothetical protein
MTMIRARQIAALAAVIALGFGASFALGRSGGESHRSGSDAAVRPAALSVPRTVAAGTLPLPAAVPDLAIPHPEVPARGGGGASTPSAPSSPPRPGSSAPAPDQAAGSAPKTTDAPEPSTAAPTTPPASQPTTSKPTPESQQPTVTTIIGG